MECKSFLCRPEGSTATRTSLPHNYDNYINNTSHRKTSRRHRPSRRTAFRTAVLTSFLQFSASSWRDTHRHLTHGRGRQSPAGGSVAAVRAEQPLNATVGGGSEGGGRASQMSGTNPSQFAARRLGADSKFHCGREQASSGGGEATLLSTAPPPPGAAPEKNKHTRDKRRFHTWRCEQTQVGQVRAAAAREQYAPGR